MMLSEPHKLFKLIWQKKNCCDHIFYSVIIQKHSRNAGDILLYVSLVILEKGVSLRGVHYFPFGFGKSSLIVDDW